MTMSRYSVSKGPVGTRLRARGVQKKNGQTAQDCTVLDIAPQASIASERCSRPREKWGERRRTYFPRVFAHVPSKNTITSLPRNLCPLSQCHTITMRDEMAKAVSTPDPVLPPANLRSSQHPSCHQPVPQVPARGRVIETRVAKHIESIRESEH